MTTLAAGSSVSLTLAKNGFLEIATNGGLGSVSITPTGGALVTAAWGPEPVRKRWQGYPEGAAVVLSNLTAPSVDYETDSGNLPEAVQSLVSDAGKPFDALVPPLQQVTITGAISATAALTATATGTYRKARVAWVNNGASGTAKLRIAANTDNDVHGLVAGQNVKRRDYELTMGDAVTLACAEPITRLTFSADGAITSATHSIQVTFGG